MKECVASSSEAQLWRRGGERVRSREKIDPRYAETHGVLLESKQYGQLKRRKDGHFSDVVGFSVPSGENNRDQRMLAEAHLSKKDDAIRIAISSGVNGEGKPINLKSYQMSPQGVLIDLDMMEEVDSVTGADELRVIAKGLEAVCHHERYQISERKYRIRRIKRGIGVGATSLAATGVAVLGIYSGVQAWIVEPAERANEYREEFNQNDYALPGEGINFDYHDFKTIPTDEFEAIPFYGGIDKDLSSPRLFELDYEGCASISTDVPDNGDLFVALPDTSPYIGYHFETSLEDDGFSVCLTADNPLESDADTVEIAVQVR